MFVRREPVLVWVWPLSCRSLSWGERKLKGVAGAGNKERLKLMREYCWEPFSVNPTRWLTSLGLSARKMDLQELLGKFLTQRLSLHRQTGNLAVEFQARCVTKRQVGRKMLRCWVKSEMAHVSMSPGGWLPISVGFNWACIPWQISAH